MNDKVLDKLTKVEELVADISSPPSQTILTNKELLQLMRVCSKTAQKWRDRGLITYSKIGREIFYKLSDVLDMLDKNKVEAYQF